MVSLDQFIEETLSAILRGVSNAQKLDEAKETAPEDDTLVNPDIMYGADSGPKGKNYATIGRNLVHMVDFDVAVTTSEKTAAEGKAGVFVAVLGLGVKGEISEQGGVVSRIKFQVPIALPKTAD